MAPEFLVGHPCYKEVFAHIISLLMPQMGHLVHKPSIPAPSGRISNICLPPFQPHSPDPTHLSSAEAPRRARMMSLLRRSVGPSGS